eukprot:g13600.t1 g13600   contig9:10029-12311(+)
MQFVDFDQQRLFGNKSFTPIIGQERQFTLKNAIKKRAFLTKLREIHQHQKIGERVQALQLAFQKEGKTEALEQRYNRVDYEIQCSMLAAANAQARKSFGYQWSPALVTAGRMKRFWQIVTSSKRRHMKVAPAALHLAETLQIPTDNLDDQSLTVCHRSLHEAAKRLRQVQRNDAEERLTWLEELAQEATRDDPSSDWQQILKRLVTATKTKALHRKLSAVLKPERVGMDHIEVPQEGWYYSTSLDELYEFDNGIFRAHTRVDGDLAMVAEITHENGGIRMSQPSPTMPPTWRKITNMEEMEQWLLRRNKRHLQQMYLEDSPPTLPSFAAMMGEHGTSTTVDAILDGTFDIDSIELPEQMKAWLKTMKRTPAERDLTVVTAMTSKQYQEAFKAVDERTSSSPSGLHYTLWKAIAGEDDLCAYFSVMMSLPFTFGFVNERWTKEIDVMLAKEKGVTQIHKNRLIGLLEADFNTALKWYYPVQIMGNAESSGINVNQWGGRSNRTATMCATRKLLLWEYARLTRKTTATFFGDLASCFDRVHTSISSMISQKFGMPKSVCECRAKVVKSMERFVRTAAGTSKHSYKQEETDTPLSGEIQGKGDIMALWTLQSHTMLETHNQQCPWVMLQHAADDTVSERTIDAYVDDADNYADAPETNGAEEAIGRLQTSAQIWADIVAATGDLMAFHKCNWQILAFTPVGGYVLPQSRNRFSGCDIHLRNHKGMSSKIDYKRHTDANKGLGVTMCPTGDQKPGVHAATGANT